MNRTTHSATISALDPVSVMLYITDASDIGLPPGYWPEAIVVPGLGNGMPLVRTKGTITNDSIEYVRYRQELGCIDLDVYND